MPENDLATELAGWKGKCQDKGEEVGWKDGVHTEFGYRPFQDTPHRACNGTGKVYLFGDSVRVPCPWELYHTHERAKCSGWTASTDLAMWLEAAREIMVQRRWVLSPERHEWYVLEVNSYRTPEEGIKYKNFEEIARGGTPLEALQQALLSCVKQVLEKPMSEDTEMFVPVEEESPPDYRDYDEIAEEAELLEKEAKGA